MTTTRTLIFVVALASAAPSASASEANDDPSGPIAGNAAEICLHIDVRFAGRAPRRAIVQSMQDEVSSIWRPYGVRIGWPDGEGPARCLRADASFDVLVAHQPTGPLADSVVVLGSTHLVASRIDRAPVRLDYGAIERVLGLLTASWLNSTMGRGDIKPTDVGRALGRVLAHEIGHVVLGTAAHQREGLMRPTFAPTDLVRHHRSGYVLSPGEIVRLRERAGILRSDASTGLRSD